MKSIEVNNEYKQQKLKEKYEKAIEKRKVSLLQKRELELQKYKEATELRYEKKIQQLESKKKKELENKLRVIEWKKPLKKNMISKSVMSTKMKQKAFAMFQLWCRIARSDNNWNVRLVDTWEVVRYDDRKKCNAWHYYWKKNNPHMAFIEDNCRPISPRMNKLQWEMTWLQRREWLVFVIWEDRVSELDEISKDLVSKNKVRQFDYYNSQYEKYESLVNIEKEKRWIAL